MVYGGQRDGVRGRPVRKHRVYAGPRTVRGISPPPRLVVECVEGAHWWPIFRWVWSYWAGSRGFLRVCIPRLPKHVGFFSSPVTRLHGAHVWVRENETKVRAAARLHCRRARVLHAAPDDVSAHERRRRRHYPHANRGVQASDNRVTFRRAAGTGDHRGEHLHAQDASIACYALICIGTARCL